MESSPQPYNQVTSSMEKYEYCERKRKQDKYEYKDAKNMKEIINWLQKYIIINKKRLGEFGAGHLIKMKGR